MYNIYINGEHEALAVDHSAARVVVAALVQAGYNASDIYAEVDGQHYCQASQHLLLPLQ
jgi:hypothetical protein